MHLHSFHVHGTNFDVFDSEGKYIGTMDTVNIDSNQVLYLKIKFERNGRYLMHCHNLEHAQEGMVTNIKID